MIRLTLAAFGCAALALPAAAKAQNRRELPAGTAPQSFLSGAPGWLKTYKFKQDKFTFVRVIYTSPPARGRVRVVGGRWATDYPDADLAICKQVEALTALKAEPVTLQLTDETLPQHPFLYLCEAGQVQFTDGEVAALRKYLEGGGFLMVDDFWGAEQYDSFCRELLRVFPERAPKELPLEHELFHCVFDLNEKPQVPSISAAMQGRAEGITWEDHGPDSKEAHYRAITDDAGRIMVLLCHNTDLSDGWERSDVDPWYTAEFSAKRAFPMGINIVFYALTPR